LICQKRATQDGAIYAGEAGTEVAEIEYNAGKILINLKNCEFE